MNDSREGIGCRRDDERFHSTIERMVFGSINQPGTLVIALTVALMGVAWALVDGTLRLDSRICDIFKTMMYALGSFGVCGFVAWAMHACTHNLMLDGQTRPPRNLYEAITMGPWTPKRIIGAFVVPLYWTHAMHHHPDPDVHDSFGGHVSEFVATAVTGGCLIPAAILYPMYIHLGSAIAFCVFYTSIHLLNYHYGWSDIHMLHHKDPGTNYTPNFCDLLFGTTNHVEDVWHETPNVFAGCVVALLFIAWKTRRSLKGMHY